jgi:hypothetical protein
MGLQEYYATDDQMQKAESEFFLPLKGIFQYVWY